MQKGYILSDEGFEELARTHEAMNTLHQVLYETESSQAIFKAESFAALLSCFVDSLEMVLKDARFQQ